MSMFLFEECLEFCAVKGHDGLLSHFRQACVQRVPEDLRPVRFVIAATTGSGYQCEVGLINGLERLARSRINSLFDFRRRLVENTTKFNVVLLVPTGVGAEIGGHAGDAGPVARMVAQVSDTLVLHPNVVNASDLNETPENALYVEGKRPYATLDGDRWTSTGTHEPCLSSH